MNAIALPQRKDLFLGYSFIDSYRYIPHEPSLEPHISTIQRNLCFLKRKLWFDYFSTKEAGSEYLQAYAKYLEKEFKDKSIEEIFGLVHKVMEVSIVIHPLINFANHIILH